MDLDLAQVRAFVATAEQGNLTRAAAQLFVSQQALSKRIARLEATVGRLFDRRPGGLALTERGVRFLPVARELLATADAALTAARGAPLPALRVDVWGHLHPVHALVQEFAAARPEVVVEISMRRNFPLALTGLQRRELDAAAGNIANLGEALAPELCAELVTATRIAALVSEGNALAGREVVGPGDLGRAGLWWPTAASSPELNAVVEEYARSIDAPLRTDGRNIGIEASIAVLRGNPRSVLLVGSDWPIPSGLGVRVLPITPAPYFPWYLVWPGRAAHPLIPALVESMRAGGDLPRRGDDVWLPAGA